MVASVTTKDVSYRHGKFAYMFQPKWELRISKYTKRSYCDVRCLYLNDISFLQLTTLYWMIIRVHSI